MARGRIGPALGQFLLGGTLGFGLLFAQPLLKGATNSFGTGENKANDQPTPSPSVEPTPTPSPTPELPVAATPEGATPSTGMLLPILLALLTLLVVGFVIWYFFPDLKKKRDAKTAHKETRKYHQAIFAKLKAREAYLIERWHEHQTLEGIFQLPALSDSRVPETRAAIIAYGRLLKLSTNTLADADLDPSAGSFGRAVEAFEDALRVAEAKAKDIKKEKQMYTPEDLKNLELAERLFKLVKDSGVSPGERQLAVKKLQKTLDKLSFINFEKAQETLKNSLDSAKKQVQALEK